MSYVRGSVNFNSENLKASLPEIMPEKQQPGFIRFGVCPVDLRVQKIVFAESSYPISTVPVDLGVIPFQIRGVATQKRAHNPQPIQRSLSRRSHHLTVSQLRSVQMSTLPCFYRFA